MKERDRSDERERERANDMFDTWNWWVNCRPTRKNRIKTEKLFAVDFYISHTLRSRIIIRILTYFWDDLDHTISNANAHQQQQQQKLVVIHSFVSLSWVHFVYLLNMYVASRVWCELSHLQKYYHYLNMQLLTLPKPKHWPFLGWANFVSCSLSSQSIC